MMFSRCVAALNQIGSGECRSLKLKHDDEAFLLRTRDEIRCYLNRCPHTWAPLNWRPDEFLTPEKDLIICGTHGALFRMEDGFCVAGPCAGQSLTRIALHVKDGRIYLADGSANSSNTAEKLR